MSIRWNKLLIILFLLIVNVSFSQEKNPTVYPYGGVPDSSRSIKLVFVNGAEKIITPLTFKKANFRGVKFDSRADYARAQFDSVADYERAQFHSDADYVWATFNSRAIYAWAQFDSVADFERAKFNGNTYFSRAQFHSLSYFNGAQFDSMAYFVCVKFDGKADFRGAQFHNRADFIGTQFDSLAYFGGAQFQQWADFREAKFDSINFDDSIIRDKIIFGENKNSLINFENTNFIADAKIVLYTSVNLVIQSEKIKYISLGVNLDYFSKKKIIEDLKNRKNFKDDSKAQFELNYIFDKSTMYQEQSNRYEEKWYHVWKWPKWFLNTLFYLTMGLGYRPFRLAWWILGFIIGFGIFYFFKMRDSINGYILKKFEMKESSGTKRKKDVNVVGTISRTESLMNCLYFSSMLLFSFRLKGEILTFFGLKEKRIIVGEYLLGLLIYIAFLTLAKSGSILHNLKSLFVG